MFCIQCGTSLPDEAKFCRSCGVPQTVNTPVASGAVAAAPALKPNPLAIPAEKTLPYNWGKFQGWVSLVVGIFALLLSPILIGDEKAATYVIASPLLIVSGYAFVQRKTWAAKMPFVWMAFALLLAVISVVYAENQNSLTEYQRGEEIGRAGAQAFFQLMFWWACAVYYRKRARQWAATTTRQEENESTLKCNNTKCGRIFPVIDFSSNLGIECPDCRLGILQPHDPK